MSTLTKMFFILGSVTLMMSLSLGILETILLFLLIGLVFTLTGPRRSI